MSARALASSADSGQSSMTTQSGQMGDQWHCLVSEIPSGRFSRTITLPCTIDPKKVKATFNKECILKILVPKEEKVKIVRISEG